MFRTFLFLHILSEMISPHSTFFIGKKVSWAPWGCHTCTRRMPVVNQLDSRTDGPFVLVNAMLQSFLRMAFPPIDSGDSVNLTRPSWWGRGFMLLSFRSSFYCKRSSLQNSVSQISPASRERKSFSHSPIFLSPLPCDSDSRVLSSYLMSILILYI